MLSILPQQMDELGKQCLYSFYHTLAKAILNATFLSSDLHYDDIYNNVIRIAAYAPKFDLEYEADIAVYVSIIYGLEQNQTSDTSIDEEGLSGLEWVDDILRLSDVNGEFKMSIIENRWHDTEKQGTKLTPSSSCLLALRKQFSLL